MSLRFRYRLVSKNQPVIALGGRFTRPRPVVPISLIGPAGTVVRGAILDPASDDTVFPETVAAAIGVDLSQAPTGTGAGIGLVNALLKYAQVTLRVAQATEQREWQAWIAFTAAPLAYPLLGFAGFLQFFDVLFRGALEEVELAVNALYPGT